MELEPDTPEQAVGASHGGAARGRNDLTFFAINVEGHHKQRVNWNYMAKLNVLHQIWQAVASLRHLFEHMTSSQRMETNSRDERAAAAYERGRK